MSEKNRSALKGFLRLSNILNYYLFALIVFDMGSGGNVNMDFYVGISIMYAVVCIMLRNVIKKILYNIKDEDV